MSVILISGESILYYNTRLGKTVYQVETLVLLCFALVCMGDLNSAS